MVLIVGISACAPAPDLRDDSFLQDTSIVSGEPCEAPCWQNLIAGETAWGLAQDVIETDDNYRVITTERDRRTGEAWVEFAFQDGLECCRIYTDNGETLTEILLLLAPETIVSDVVTRYGEPLYITAQEQSPEQAYIALVYPDIPMVVYAFAENVTTDEIREDSDVVGVRYLAPTTMTNLLETESLYLWDGYGELRDIVDGEFDLLPTPQTDDTDETNQ
ncbi:MAG: hypothetical protein AAFV93_07540 [Chloroflexota bacterium]